MHLRETFVAMRLQFQRMLRTSSKDLNPCQIRGRDRQCPYVTFMLSFIFFKGQVHGSAHAHLSKCCFSARTRWIVYANNMIMS